MWYNISQYRMKRIVKGASISRNISFQKSFYFKLAMLPVWLSSWCSGCLTLLVIRGHWIKSRSGHKSFSFNVNVSQKLSVLGFLHSLLLYVYVYLTAFAKTYPQKFHVTDSFDTIFSRELLDKAKL